MTELVVVVTQAGVQIKQMTIQVIRAILKVFLNGVKYLTNLFAQELFKDPVLEIPLVGTITNWEIIQLVGIYLFLRGRHWTEILFLLVVFYLLY